MLKKEPIENHDWDVQVIKDTVTGKPIQVRVAGPKDMNNSDFMKKANELTDGAYGKCNNQVLCRNHNRRVIIKRSGNKINRRVSMKVNWENHIWAMKMSRRNVSSTRKSKIFFEYGVGGSRESDTPFTPSQKGFITFAYSLIFAPPLFAYMQSLGWPTAISCLSVLAFETILYTTIILRTTLARRKSHAIIPRHNGILIDYTPKTNRYSHLSWLNLAFKRRLYKKITSMVTDPESIPFDGLIGKGRFQFIPCSPRFYTTDEELDSMKYPSDFNTYEEVKDIIEVLGDLEENTTRNKSVHAISTTSRSFNDDTPASDSSDGSHEVVDDLMHIARSTLPKDSSMWSVIDGLTRVLRYPSINDDKRGEVLSEMASLTARLEELHEADINLRDAREANSDLARVIGHVQDMQGEALRTSESSR